LLPAAVEDYVEADAPVRVIDAFVDGLFPAGLLHRRMCEEDLRSVLGRHGGDLLFQALRLSTIGAEDFDGRVRDGIGYRLLAMTTRAGELESDRN
jgi:hypothetical protein